jgi:hypothetical protein
MATDLMSIGKLLNIKKRAIETKYKISFDTSLLFPPIERSDKKYDLEYDLEFTKHRNNHIKSHF